jgi:hypothetical protein
MLTSPIQDSASGPSKATQVVTISGSVLTQTVTTMPTTSAEKLSQKQKLSNGAIIATAVAAVIAGIAILAAVIIALFCWRRRQERSSFEHNTSDVFPQRNPSVLSKAGLLGGNASLHGVGSLDNVSPMSERRNSKPLVFDQRLNPNAFMHHDDGSRTSVLTMQDNQDYTRTLNVSFRKSQFSQTCLTGNFRFEILTPSLVPRTEIGAYGFLLLYIYVDLNSSFNGQHGKGTFSFRVDTGVATAL